MSLALADAQARVCVCDVSRLAAQNQRKCWPRFGLSSECMTCGVPAWARVERDGLPTPAVAGGCTRRGVGAPCCCTPRAHFLLNADRPSSMCMCCAVRPVRHPLSRLASGCGSASRGGRPPGAQHVMRVVTTPLWAASVHVVKQGWCAAIRRAAAAQGRRRTARGVAGRRRTCRRAQHWHGVLCTAAKETHNTPAAPDTRHTTTRQPAPSAARTTGWQRARRRAAPSRPLSVQAPHTRVD